MSQSMALVKIVPDHETTQPAARSYAACHRFYGFKHGNADMAKHTSRQHTMHKRLRHGLQKDIVRPLRVEMYSSLYDTAESVTEPLKMMNMTPCHSTKVSCRDCQLQRRCWQGLHHSSAGTKAQEALLLAKSVAPDRGRGRTTGAPARRTPHRPLHLPLGGRCRSCSAPRSLGTATL
mmetsp:Transcript_48940/g.116361  ORF Transcript_48940/g.116361 Transcript_48940/m.116361 type:complete len:177 (-) Transcript_48940:1756-2286(-)